MSLGADETSYTTVRDASTFEKFLPSLRDLLQNCVNGEPLVSSVGFLAPLTQDTATTYWLNLFPELVRKEAPTTLLVLTKANSSEVIATAQIGRIPKEIHVHRAEIRKLLVHPVHRGRGHGKRLMDTAERICRDDLGLEILVLDTATETAALGFYRRTGWTEWGTCPDYAMFADGRKGAATFFYKKLITH